MPAPIDKVIKAIHSLKSIQEAEKARLLADLDELKKEFEINDFVLKRIQKDKSIVVNILETTIEDLEKSKLLLEESNNQLRLQKEELKEQKRVIEEKSASLDKNLEKLKLSYKNLEEFSYVASHDLKSPLRNIASFAQLLKRRYYNNLDQEANEFIDFIVSGVFQMTEVIHTLLEYSKVGYNQEAFAKIDLNEIIEIVKFNLKKDIEENQAVILSRGLPSITGNKTYFIQLFQNLIGNAIKFRAEQNPVIKINCLQNEVDWTIKVSDNGVGLDEAYHGKVFFPFQRLNTSDTSGMGIGLAICKKIVKMHNGDIYYKSNPEGGTTFIFNLSSIENNAPAKLMAP